MKIGIGITTYRRPKTLKLARKYFERHTREFPGVEFAYHIQTFYPAVHKSIAQVKNLCIKNLMEQDCDYLFLFDDDCFPCHPDWWKSFVEAHLRTNQHHLIFAVEGKYATYPTDEGNGLLSFTTVPGCCLFLTKYAVMAVGGFDESFDVYGYEHEQYSHRILGAGMNSILFPSPQEAEKYIWSLDIQGGKHFANQLGNEFDERLNRPKSVIPLSKMQASLAVNKEIFEKGFKILIPIEYD